MLIPWNNSSQADMSLHSDKLSDTFKERTLTTTPKRPLKYKYMDNWLLGWLKINVREGQARMENTETLATLGTQDTGQINVREN